MKKAIIETPEGYTMDIVDKVDNILIRFLKEEKYVPNDGDIVFSDNVATEWIAVYKSRRSCGTYNHYVFYLPSKDRICFDDWSDIGTTRPATPEEARRLFGALEREGKRWNAEKKCVEDIPKPLEINKGDILRCIEDVVVTNGWVAYVKGRLYMSEIDGCVTNETGNTAHVWDNVSKFSKHFVRLGSLG